MTKISFDLDFNKDSETLLKEIQEQAKAEVEKREGKERAKAYLSNLHETVNDKIGTTYKSATDLIRALAEYSSPAMRERITGSTAGGRRKTISMNQELYEQIKEALSQPSPNKAAIARETNVSVVQVRKVATGGYDEKFGGSSIERDKVDSKPFESLSTDTPNPEPEKQPDTPLPEPQEIDLPPPDEIPDPENETVEEKLPEVEKKEEVTDSIIPDLPPPPSFNEEEKSEIPEEENDTLIPPPPSVDDEEDKEAPSPFESNLGGEVEAESDIATPPPPPPISFEESADKEVAPSLPPSLPPAEDSFAKEDEGADSSASSPVLPAHETAPEEPESTGPEDIPLPPPALPPVSEALPDEPPTPAPPPSPEGEPDSPPPPSPPAPPAPPSPSIDPEGERPSKPSLGKKPGLKLGGPSKKPSLKLGGKAGKAGKPTLNITRPPIAPKSLPPTPDA